MEWTAENNKETINGLLDNYADLLAVYREFVDQNLDAELPTKLKALQTLKSLATTIDTLLKRWSFAYRGYDGNTHQAREDATRSLAERTSLTDSEEEEDFHDGDDAEWVELKIVLRELPEIRKMDIRWMGNRSHRQQNRCQCHPRQSKRREPRLLQGFSMCSSRVSRRRR